MISSTSRSLFSGSPAFESLVRSAVAATLLLSIVAAPAAAQTPRFGTDTAQFRITNATTTATNVMGMNMDLAFDVILLVSMRVTKLGGDTLRVHGVLDSLAFVPKGEMAQMMGAELLSEFPAKKGDSAVMLMSTRGEAYQHVTGAEELFEGFTGFENMPADVKPGQSWKPAPDGLLKDLKDEFQGNDKVLAEFMEKLMTSATARFDGETTRDGVKAFKIVGSMEGASGTITAPDSSATMTIKEMKFNAEQYLDLDGRMLFNEETNSMKQDIQARGTTATVTVNSTVKTERIR